MLCRPYFKLRGIRHHTGGVSYFPTAVARLYGFPAGVDGSGQKIGIIELGGGFRQSELDQYFTSHSLHVRPVRAVSVDGAQNSPGGEADGEVMLDLCIVGAVAPGAEMLCYFAPNSSSGFANAIMQAVLDGCSAISISWGSPEASWGGAAGINPMRKAFAAAQAAGVTVTAAAGDNGSSDGLRGNNADYPSSDPLVLGCGGTTLITQSDKLTSETVWNNGARGGATGGGVSALFPLPMWQNGIGLPGSHRCVPDVAGVADPETGWLVSVNNQPEVVGGTSAVAPMWAALAALLNQALGKRIGYLNPAIYALKGKGFRDITQGNNGTFVAKAGPDCCTGWGVPVGTVLLQALGGAVIATPIITGPLIDSTVVGQPYNYRINASGNPAAFAASGLPTGLTCDSAGLISGAVQAPGVSNITLTASNGGGSGTAVLVLSALPAPVIPPPDDTFTVPSGGVYRVVKVG